MAPRRSKSQSRQSLADEYTVPSTKSTKSPKRGRTDDEEQHYVDGKQSRKVLRLAKSLEDEDNESRQQQLPVKSTAAFSFESRFPLQEPGFGEDAETWQGADDEDEEAWGDEEEEEEVVEEVEADDLDIFNKLNPTNDDPILRGGEAPTEGESTNLADLILAKIAEHEAKQGANDGGLPDRGGLNEPDDIELPEKVVEVYSQCGLILSRYKAGKIPKPIKIAPGLPQYGELLAITRPGEWSPNAVYAVTRVFASAKPAVAQDFIRNVVLPRCREDISETKKLNIHLYNSIKKTLYRPSAFFRGFLFPLLQSQTCTQREAHIISSVLTRVSIPVLHSAAALYRLCDIAAETMLPSSGRLALESAGAANMFIKVLLEKKYALPYKVIDNLVFHFLRFKNVSIDDGDSLMGGVSNGGGKGGQLPVVWHQCLLAFAQRYRNDITEDQREALLDLLLVKGHKQIGPDIRRELIEGRGRGVVIEPEVGNGGDDTMVLAVDTVA